MTVVQIVEIATGKVEREIDVTNKSEHLREKLIRGIEMNLDHDRYRVALQHKGKSEQEK